MFTALVHYFYPDLRKEEIKKFSLLAAAFFCTIGAYWMLRLLKDTVFFKIAFPASLGWLPNQGGLFQPLAKMLSPFVVLFLYMVYTRLVDLFEKQKLFYIFCTVYATIFSVIAAVLFARDMWGDAAVGKLPLALLGWGSYFAIESFGSIVVALFWSFAASITQTDEAKRGYPVIIAAAQLGSIGGSALPLFSKYIGGIWKLFVIATFFIAAISWIIYVFMRVVPTGNKSQSEDRSSAKKSASFGDMFAGFKLLFTRGYLFGILILSTFYEIVATIIDYQMKRQADLYPEFATPENFAWFLSIFGVATNTLAFIIALLGTSYLIKRYSLTFCLLLYPIVLGIAMVALYLFFLLGNPTAAQLLWSTFGVMMLAKGLSYAVNNPTKEMMYIPTSKDARFKTKGLIDMFGSRVAKSGGGSFVNLFKRNISMLMGYGTLLSLGLVGIWIVAALYVGKKNRELIDSGTIVE